MSQPIRVLHVFHNMGNGGIEHFVMDYYRHMDREKIQFDFLMSVSEKGYFDDEIISLGGKVFHAASKRNPIQNFRSIARIVKENNYKIVHRHTGSCISNIDLLAARKGGATSLISHSHTTSAGKPWLHYMAKRLLKVDCVQFACSEEAGWWLFGKKSKKPTTIIHNAIEVEKYKFSPEVRDNMRAEFSVDKEIVIGHVGAFNRAKNQSFLVEIFSKAVKENPLLKLWLVGDGEFREQVEEQVKRLGIGNHVEFLGNRDNVYELLQAMDLFVLPSLYEGFPISLVEAQTAGLTCYVSQAVPKSINVLGTVQFLPIDEGQEQWIRTLAETNQAPERLDMSEVAAEKGYDIRTEAAKLGEIYLNMAEKE